MKVKGEKCRGRKSKKGKEELKCGLEEEREIEKEAVKCEKEGRRVKEGVKERRGSEKGGKEMA